MTRMSDRRPELPNRQIPFSEAFRKFIVQGWAPDPKDLPGRLPAAVPARRRRERVSAQFPGERLVIPAGGLKVRSNDTDYRFRPHSAFAHLTGLGTDREPDAVLVLEPTDSGHDATLYFRPRAPRDSEEFYADSRFGELWVGRRASLEEMSRALRHPLRIHLRPSRSVAQEQRRHPVACARGQTWNPRSARSSKRSAVPDRLRKMIKQSRWLPQLIVSLPCPSASCG